MSEQNPQTSAWSTPQPLQHQPQQHQGPHAQQFAPQQQPPRPPGSGLAIAAFVLGLLGFLLAWIPVVGIFFVLLGILGLVLGVVALVRARTGRAGGKGLAIAGVVLAALGVLGGIAANVLFGAAVNEVDQAIDDAAQDAEDSAADQGVEPEAGEAEAADEAQVLPLGQAAEVGEYQVAVTAVDLDAAEEIEAANEFNEPATGQYVLVDLAVTYTGDEEGDPWIDLSTVFTGSDARQYDSSSCAAVTPSPAVEVPTLNAGGQATYSVCFDVPPAAVEGGSLYLEESLSLDGPDQRVFWAIR